MVPINDIGLKQAVLHNMKTQIQKSVDNTNLLNDRMERIGGEVTGLGACFSPRLQRQARAALQEVDTLTVQA